MRDRTVLETKGVRRTEVYNREFKQASTATSFDEVA